MKFVETKYNQKDFQLDNLDNKFQEGFHLYLSGALGKKNTASKYITLFRSVIKLVSVEGWIKKYPFIDYKMKRDTPTRYDVLTSDIP